MRLFILFLFYTSVLFKKKKKKKKKKKNLVKYLMSAYISII